MLEIEEVISLGIGIVFLVYITYSVITPKKIHKSYWYFGIVFIILSKIFTVGESFMFPEIFNYIEHISILFGCTCFLISVLKKEL